MTDFNFNPNSLKRISREIGLTNPKNQFYNERIRKHHQILGYIKQIESALNKLSKKRPIVFLDCGCGMSYLSFMLYEYCQTVINRPIKIIGIDRNAALIKQCTESADALGFENMQFISGDIDSIQLNESIDVVYSLHACDSATDQMIATGVKVNARYIFSVSCCQHKNRKAMSHHPLTSVSRHYPYKERLVDMLGDSMRALLLESLGYRVNIFEFVASERTPKNAMLRAIKNAARKQDQEAALERYHELVKLFGFSPALEKMLPNVDRALRLRRIAIDERGSFLSKKEVICLTHVLRGRRAKKIGEILHMSLRTVEWHIKNVKEKTCCSTKNELVDFVEKRPTLVAHLERLA